MIDDGTPVEITLAANAPAIETKVATRAMGTVGGTTTATNKWAGEELVIYGYRTKPNATSGAIETDVYINGLKVPAPVDGAENMLAEFKHPDGTYKDEPYFYQNNEVFDFYGYYIDNAATGAVTANSTTLTVPFKIDGGHDLMIAKTDKAADVGDADVPLSKLYSSTSARKGVTPNLQFKHALSRFTFEVLPGSASARDIYIKAVKVKGIPEGTLNILGGDAATKTITPSTTATAVDFELRQVEGTGADRELVALDPTNPNLGFMHVGPDPKLFDKANYEPKPIGESIMVIPGQKSYPLTVSFGWQDDKYQQALNDLTANINIDEVAVLPNQTKGDVFEAGKSYKITIVVYGPEKIELKAELAPWVEVGTQIVDQDDAVSGYLEISPAPGENDVMTFSSAAINEKINVFAEKDKTWTVTVSEANDNWLKVDKVIGTDPAAAATVTGTGNEAFYFVAEANTSATDSRTAKVTVTIENVATKVFNVTQSANTDNAVKFEEQVNLSLKNDVAAAQTVELTAIPADHELSTEVVYAGEGGWLTVALDVTTTGSEKVTITPTANTSANQRTATVKVIATPKAATAATGSTPEPVIKNIVVIQAGATVKLPTIKTLAETASFSDGKVEVAYELSAAGDVVVADIDATWASYTIVKDETDPTTKGKVVFYAQENPYADARTATATVKVKGETNADNFKPVTLTQSAATVVNEIAAITVDDIAATGTLTKAVTVAITVKDGGAAADVTPVVTIPEDAKSWLSAKVEGKEITFTATENKGAERTATNVKVSAVGAASVTFNVKQEAATSIQ